MVKITIDLGAKKVLILSALLIFILLSALTMGATARRKATSAEPESPSIATQFVKGFSCMIFTCGWPAIVLMVLPAVAVFIWKKIFSVG